MQLMTSTMEIPRPATFDPDLPLVEASQRGDVSAFEELVRRYDRKLLRIAINVTHNPDDAEDAVQDAFFKIRRVRMRGGMRSLKTTALVHRDVNQHGAIRYEMKHVSCNELGRGGSHNEHCTNH